MKNEETSRQRVILLLYKFFPLRSKKVNKIKLKQT